MENAIYDPRTTRVVNGQVVRDPFPNNVIPRELLDPVALEIQALIPMPDNGELLNNWGPGHREPPLSDDPERQDRSQLQHDTKLSAYWSVQDTDQITGAGRPAHPDHRRGATRRSTATPCG